MGLDCYARLVAGVKFEDVYKEKIVKTKIIRYNEITGEPYEKQIETKIRLLGTQEFSENDWNDFKDLLQFRAEEGELDHIHVADDDPGILGRIVASTDSHRMGTAQIVKVTQKEIEKVLDDVKQSLSKYGIPSSKVNLFIMPHYSY